MDIFGRRKRWGKIDMIRSKNDVNWEITWFKHMKFIGFVRCEIKRNILPITDSKFY
jgi:hypothetical protein